MSINLQPLTYHQHLKPLAFRQRHQLVKAIKTWNEDQLSINQLVENQAIYLVNKNGHSYENILNELTSQIPNHTDQLQVKLQARPSSNPIKDEQLKLDLQTVGYKPHNLKSNYQTYNKLFEACYDTNICNFNDLINAINQQLINSQGLEITLKIGQTKDIQQSWQTLEVCETSPNYQESQVGNARLIPNQTFKNNINNQGE